MHLQQCMLISFNVHHHYNLSTLGRLCPLLYNGSQERCSHIGAVF